MASDTPTMMSDGRPNLEAAVSAVEQRLDGLAANAEPDAVAVALAPVLEPLARAAKEVLR